MLQMSGQDNTVKYLLKFASNLIYESRNSTVAGFGSILILASIYKVFSHIKSNLNDIWHVYKHDNILRLTVTFTTIGILAPAVILITSAVNIFIVAFLDAQLGSINLKSAIFIECVSELLSYLLISALFAWIYIIIPQTKVKVLPACIAALISAFIHIVLQKALIYLQVYMVSQSVIFGSFAALPILMTWMQLAWMVVLYGSVLTYTIQFKPKSIRDLSIHSLPLSDKIQIVTDIIEYMHAHDLQDKVNPSISDIAEHTTISYALIEQALSCLMQAKIIAEVYYHGDKHLRYTLAIKVKSSQSIRNLLLIHQNLKL